MEKPLHVRVAEALGWHRPTLIQTGHRIYGNLRNAWFAGEPQDGGDPVCGTTEIPRYDTDWSVTGPLFERFVDFIDRLQVAGPNGIEQEVVAYCEGINGRGPNTLIATCNLILALASAGKLAA